MNHSYTDSNYSRLNETQAIPKHEEAPATTVEREPERRNYAVCCFQIFFMVFYTILFPSHLFCLGISVVFDTVCLVKEGTSLVNCSQKVILERPQPLVILCWVTTIFNTAVVLITLRFKPTGINFCGFRNAFGRLIRKGSFWSLNITYIFSIVDYIIVMCEHLSGLNSAVAATLVLFFAPRLIVAYSINYLLPVKFPPVGERNFVRLYTWLGYWVTLVMFFLDTCHAALAVTLDVAEKVTPLGNKQPGSHEFDVVAHLLLLGTKATFEARMFLFYWNKLFHGNKDLFSAALILRSIPIERSDREGRIQIL